MYRIIILGLVLVGLLQAQPAFDIPGFFNEDGSVHEILDPYWPWGDTINVLDYGADVLDNDNDDRPAVQAAINVASMGDLVYFPNGVYNLTSVSTSSSTSHIVLSDGYHLHGESMEGAVIKSQFPLSVNQNSTTRTVSIQGKYGVTIKNLTFTSDFSGVYYTDRVNNNPDRSAPGVHLYIDDSGSTPSRRVTVDSCKFEKFRAAAIRLANSSDCVVRNCDFSLATDVGGGGAGYGISLQGNGHGNDSYGLFRDSRYNLIENNTFTGPQIRHGVVIQYYSHNNLIRNNVLIGTIMDALDLHGEDEYNNELCYNTVTDVTMGGGVGIGNTGADHDASGYNNYIHHNTFDNCREGVKVYLGSPYTRIEHNIVENTTVSSSRGIYILNGPHTTIKNNIIRYNTSTGFIGIYLKHDPGTLGAYDGDPEYVWIDSNEVSYNANGIWIENGQNIYYGPNNIVHSNSQSDTLFGVNVSWWDVSDVDEPIQPVDQLLLTSYPNPFNSGFVLEFQLPLDGQTDIQIVDIRGRQVAQIHSGFLSAGQHGVHLNTPGLSSGIYFIHLKQGADTQTHKIILAR